MNQFHTDLEDKIVELKEELFKEEYKDIKYRLVKVTGGSGACGQFNVDGTKISIEFLHNSEQDIINVRDVARIISK